MDSRIALSDILKFCETDPTAVSWIAFFDDLQDQSPKAVGGPDAAPALDIDTDIQSE